MDCVGDVDVGCGDVGFGEDVVDFVLLCDGVMVVE